MRFFLKRILPAVLVLIIAGAALVYIFAWRSPPFYSEPLDCRTGVPVMSQQEYDAVHEYFKRPYIIELSSGSGGGVYFYGSTHTRNPSDEQIEEITEAWKTFKPTTALLEGRLGFLLPGLMDPVEEYGESAWVYKLAKDDGIKCYSWEQSQEDEITAVLKKFTPEQTAVFYILRPYFGNIRFGKPADPDAYISEYIKKRTKHPKLQGTITSPSDIDAVWKRDFRGLADWRETSDEYGLPGWLGEISAYSNFVRNEHLACLIITLVNKGEKVFVVGGSSHPVSVERTLKDGIK